MRLPKLMLATAFVVATTTACAIGPDRLPDLASEYSADFTILINHVEVRGGPAVRLGPVEGKGIPLDMFAACIGGGKMTLTAISMSDQKGKAKIAGSCNGQQIGGGEFYSGRYDTKTEAFCLVPSFKGNVTAWEVLVTESQRSGTPAPHAGGC
jgi:hypothetical protein